MEATGVGELERRATTEYISAIFPALALSELGDRERARTLLGEAFTERSSMLGVPWMPCLRRLRAEPLMEDLRQRLLGEEHKGKSG